MNKNILVEDTYNIAYNRYNIISFKHQTFIFLILFNPAFTCKSLIDFNEAFIPYNKLQFLDWPRIVAHSPTGQMYIAYGLVILVHRNIQVITIGYIQFCQGMQKKSWLKCIIWTKILDVLKNDSCKLTSWYTVLFLFISKFKYYREKWIYLFTVSFLREI